MDSILVAFEEALLDSDFKRYHINSGGCAKAAVVFYKYFKQYPEIKVKGAMIVNWCNFYKNKVSLTNMVTNSKDMPMYCNHVVLVFEYKQQQYVIDAIEGISLKKDYVDTAKEKCCNVITGYVKPKLLKKVANTKQGWNDTFNVYDLKYLRSFLQGYKLYG